MTLCEQRDDTRISAGFEVVVLIDGEPMYSRRCGDQAEADFVACAIRQDSLRTGWTDVQSDDAPNRPR